MRTEPHTARVVARAAALIALTGALALNIIAAAAPGAPRAEGAVPGQAPDFRLPLLSGGTISLADFRGRPLILLFWAPW